MNGNAPRRVIGRRIRVADFWILALVLVLALLLPACGPTRVEGPRIDDSDYIFPELPRGELDSRDEKALRGAWTDVLTGQTARAEQTAGKLLSARPGLVAAQTLLGFAAMRANRLEDASQIFSTVLAAEPENSVALVGLGPVRRKAGLPDHALPPYIRAEHPRPRALAPPRRGGGIEPVAAGAANG